jgi:hypothetical protein
MTAHNQWLSTTRSIPYWTMSVFSFTVTNDERGLTAHTLNSLTSRVEASRVLYYDRRSVNQVYDKIFITVRHLRVCWCGALSLTRGRVCHLQLLLALASAVILGSQSSETRDHILMSQIRTPLRLNYDSFITSRQPEYRSPSQTVPLLFCVIRCQGNLRLPNCCLANGLPLPVFRRCLQNRCLAMVIFFTIFIGVKSGTIRNSR